MAVLKNTTTDVLALFRPDAPPIQPGDEITVSDENFADRAWPKGTWGLVKKPGKAYTDASTDDAHLFLSAPAEEPEAADDAVDTEEKS